MGGLASTNWLRTQNRWQWILHGTDAWVSGGHPISLWKITVCTIPCRWAGRRKAQTGDRLEWQETILDAYHASHQAHHLDLEAGATKYHVGDSSTDLMQERGSHPCFWWRAYLFFVCCPLALRLVQLFFGGPCRRLEAATPSSILFLEAEVTLRFFSRATLHWALVISLREPLSLKDAVDFTMVHGSLYCLCFWVVGSDGYIHRPWYRLGANSWATFSISRRIFARIYSTGQRLGRRLLSYVGTTTQKFMLPER